MSPGPLEIVPLRDDPEPFCWSAPEQAEYYTVYERDDDDLARAIVDVPTLDDALTYALSTPPAHAFLWTGAMLVEVSAPAFLQQSVLTAKPWRTLDRLPHEVRASANGREG